MRISDWSSDVCSSDLDRQSNVQIVDWRNAPISRIYYRYEEGDDYEEEIAGRRVEGFVEARRNISIARGNLRRDRKSVVEGKRVSVRVDLGGRRSIKKKNKNIVENLTYSERESR